MHHLLNCNKVENLKTKGLQLEIKLFTNVNPRLQLWLIQFSEQWSLHKTKKSLFVKGVVHLLS